MNALLLLIAMSMAGLTASPLLGCGGNTHSGRLGCLHNPNKPSVSTVFFFAETQEDGGLCFYRKNGPREKVLPMPDMTTIFPQPWVSSASVVPMTSVKQIEAKGTLFSPKSVTTDDVIATLKEKIADEAFLYSAYRITDKILNGVVAVEQTLPPRQIFIGPTAVPDPNSVMLHKIINAINETSLRSTASACAAQSQT